MPSPSTLMKRESRLAKADKKAIEALADMFRVEIDNEEIEDGDLEAYQEMLLAEQRVLEEDMTGEDEEEVIVEVVPHVPLVTNVPHASLIEESSEESSEEDATSSFVDELRHRPFVHQLHEKIRELGITNAQLARLILYQECKSHEKSAPFADITHGTLDYRFVLDSINKAIGNPTGSPLAMSFRALQMTCSASSTLKSTSNEIPTMGSNLRDGISYEERASLFLKQRTDLLRFVSGIFDRLNNGLTFLDNALPMRRLELIQAIEKYASTFASLRTDMRPALFGIAKDLDPTRSPINLGDKFRESIEILSLQIVMKQTSLKDSSGARLPFHGAFWMGKEPLYAGQNLGYYEGRILSECDNTQLFSHRPSEYSLLIDKYKILVDSTNAADGNWTRYINDGARKGEENQSNLKFARDGSVVTTKTVLPNSELFVTYGDEFWSWFK